MQQLNFNIKHLILLLLLTAYTPLISQEQKESKIILEKRCRFLIDITEQVKGFKLKGNKFRIGVLNNYSISTTLKDITKSRTIKGKKVTVTPFYDIKSIKNIDLIYVHGQQGYNKVELFNKLKKKSILLISEYQNINHSLINISHIDQDFFIDINLPNMSRFGFKPSTNLIQYSIQSMQNWKILYNNTLKKKTLLEFEKKILTNQVKNAHEKLKDKTTIIEKSKIKVNELERESEIQKSKHEEEIESFKNLETDYENQKKALQIKIDEIERKKKQIDVQDQYLQNQKKQILTQKKILGDQKLSINKQRKINILLICSILLAIGFIAYIIRTSYNNRKLVKRLQQQNKEIDVKSRILSRQNKEFELFAYIASHDLQEPLHTITSFADFMHEDYYDKLDETANENLDYIKDGCKRMSLLIKSLLDYSKIGNQRKLVFIESSSIITEVIQDFNARINQTNTLIELGNLPKIYAYPIELRLLFQNLISNAIKFRKKDCRPCIFIEGKRINPDTNFSHRWLFKITDNGIGIANEYQTKIFDIFQRLHTREEYEGTGIGLAHCKKIIGFHHGDLWVNSALNKGTTINFTIQFNPEDYPNINISDSV